MFVWGYGSLDKLPRLHLRHLIFRRDQDIDMVRSVFHQHMTAQTEQWTGKTLLL